MSRKTIIVAGAAVLLCVVCLLITSISTHLSSRASNYGIDEPGKSALVIQNETSAFYILDVSITGQASQEWHQLIGKGAERAFAIEPGTYSVSIHYSDRTDLSNLSFMTWYVSAYKKAEFTIKKGYAAVFVLQGGRSTGIMYDPPDLVRK